MSSGEPLSDAACDTLFRTAVLMTNSGDTARKVVNDDVMGVVTTDFECAQLGSFIGPLFEAEISTIKGQSKVSYIVTTRDIEEAKDSIWLRLSKKSKKRRKK